MNFCIEGTRSPLRQNSVCYKRADARLFRTLMFSESVILPWWRAPEEELLAQSL